MAWTHGKIYRYAEGPEPVWRTVNGRAAFIGGRWDAPHEPVAKALNMQEYSQLSWPGRLKIIAVSDGVEFVYPNKAGEFVVTDPAGFTIPSVQAWKFTGPENVVIIYEFITHADLSP